jgi:SagB-type dehydrogenase family enzyme
VLVDTTSLQRFRANPTVVDLLSHLDSWKPVDALDTDDAPMVRASLDRLVQLGLLECADDAGSANGRDLTLDLWSPYELAMHRLVSAGGYRGDQEVGRADTAPSVRKPRAAGDTVKLPKADPQLNITLSDALEQRRTIRTYGDRAMTLAELATMLHYAARMTRMRHDPALGDEALHTYPTGGARSELELYVVANDVAGLDAGAYYFDPVEETVTRVDAAGEDGRQRLLRNVHGAAGKLLNRDPQVVLVITAVFGRVMWKYRDIGLVMIYKDTGCLMQTLYLVCTATQLAPCAIGGGNEIATSRWLGLDPLVEAQVGCFLVGVPQDVS